MLRFIIPVVTWITLTSFLVGCSSFTSHEKREATEKISDISQSSAQNNASNSNTKQSAGVVPDLPDLEPIQEAKNVELTENKKNTEITQTPNTVAKTDNDSPISVVRLPKAEPTELKKTSEIQQVSYEEPIMESLPDTPIATGETRPNQWQGVNSKQSDLTELEPISPSTEPTEKKVEKKATLPNPITDNTQTENSIAPAELDIPNEVLEPLPPSVMPDSQPSDKDVTLPTLSATDKTSQATNPEANKGQGTALEPVTQLQMSSLAFVTAIRKKGDFTAVTKPYSFKPGQKLLLYMEIENPNSVTKLNSGFEITDNSGKKVLAQSTSSDTPTNETSFFQYVKFELPDNLTPGDYAVRVWGKAPNEKDLVSAKLCFQVK